jgi:hypothetical protein
MKMFCPLCAAAIPEEDQDVMTSPDAKLISQVQCRPCGKVFTICQETRFMKLRVEGRPIHPEDK